MEATFLDDGNRHPVKRRQRIESCTQGNSYLFIHNVCQQLLQVKGFRSQGREMLSTYRWSRSLGTRYKSSLTRCLALNTPLTAPCEIGWDWGTHITVAWNIHLLYWLLRLSSHRRYYLRRMRGLHRLLTLLRTMSRSSRRMPLFFWAVCTPNIMHSTTTPSYGSVAPGNLSNRSLP